VLLTGIGSAIVVYRKRTKNGTYKWVESVCRALRDSETNQITELQVATRDIHLRKQAEENLEREREYFKAVLDNISDGIVACDEKGVLSFFNKTTRIMHGIPEKHIPADQWADYYDLYYPDGKTRLRKEDIPLFKAFNGEPVSGIGMVISPKNGKKRSILSDGTRIVAANGKILGAVAVMHDVTEQKEAQEKLVRSEAMLLESQAIAHVGSWEWDIESDRVVWSDELKRIYGYSA
jgi:PAS domain S-box-containing protein